MTDYKKISRKIRIVYAALLFVVVALTVMCEYNVIPVEGILLSVDAGTMYVVEVSMLFVVGLGLLAALKGFNWCMHHKVYVRERSQRVGLYKKLSHLRNVLLAVLMLAGVFFYYGTLENWGLYYALAAFVTSFFCLPSPEGVEIELDLTD